MSLTFIDGVPRLADSIGALSLRTRAFSAFLSSPSFVARLSLDSAEVAWLNERPPFRMTGPISKLPRRIAVSGSYLWRSETEDVVAELLHTEDGGAQVSARHATTGRLLWEHYLPMPEAADWAESSPAWPGAQTEENTAFFAGDPTRLVVCVTRQSRRSQMYSPQTTVDSLPPYGCQLDATRFDASSGSIVWRESYRDVAVGILERRVFFGAWSSGSRVGVLDLETGTNRVLHEFPYALGWPIRDDSSVAVPWHSSGEVGIHWLDEQGKSVRQARWKQPRVNATSLRATEAGLALQINEQILCWLGTDAMPLWTVRAKPYIYQVHCSPITDVFVGTDGRGGRLLAFDRASGYETLNLKPPLGGAGTLAKVPAHEVLVARFCSSRRDWDSSDLLVLSMGDRSHRLVCKCREFLGTWLHGAICVAGKNGERLVIVDVR